MKSIVKKIAGKPNARPVTSILNSAFEYTPSHQTNLAEKFKRLADAKARAASERQTVPMIGKRVASK